MESDGRGSRGRKIGVEAGNVVPFPGNWIGAREALVPFGPGIEDEPSEATAAGVEEPEAVALGADAFWGGSAVVQEAIQAPVKPAGLGEAEPLPEATGPRVARPARRGRRRFGSARDVAAGVCAAACLVVGVVLVVGGGSGHVRPGIVHLANASQTGAASGVGADQLGARLSGGRQLAEEARVASVAAAGRRAGGGGRAARHHGRSVAKRRSGHGRASGVTRSVGGSAGEPVVETDQSAPAETDRPSSAAEPASSTPGPIGPGAAFGPGEQG